MDQLPLLPNEKIDYGGYFTLHPATLTQLQYKYAPVAVDVELLHMVDWLDNNPRKAKKKLWNKFITRWLRREYAKVQRQRIEARRLSQVGATRGKAHYSAEDLAWRKECGL